MVPVGYQNEVEYETSWQYETGIYHRFAEIFDNRFVLYYTEISDYLAIDRADPEHNDNQRSGWNLDEIRRWGIEYEFNATIKDLTIYGNYTYIASRVKEDDPRKLTLFWVDLPPKHKAGISLRYAVSDSVMLTWDQRYVGKRLSEGGLTLDPYTRSDLGAQYSFLQNKAKLIVYVNNLLGTNYEEVYGYPMPRQVIGVTVKYTLF